MIEANRLSAILRDAITQRESNWPSTSMVVSLALRVTTSANMGAYLSTVGPAVPTLACKGMQSGVYRFDAIHVTIRGVFTNTVSVDAYRGAGNPETQYMLERVIDVAATQVGIDRIELRRHNMIGAADVPFTTVLGHTYARRARARRARRPGRRDGLADRIDKDLSCPRRLRRYIDCTTDESPHFVERVPAARRGKAPPAAGDDGDLPLKL